MNPNSAVPASRAPRVSFCRYILEVNRKTIDMRRLLPVCIGLYFAGSLAAQPSEVPGDQYLPGTLIFDPAGFDHPEV
jgi:hypothetical protein